MVVYIKLKPVLEDTTNKMSSAKEKPKFVSNIPNNKLEPVFIGRSDKEALMDSNIEQNKGVYVPAFLKNKQDDVRSVSFDSETGKKIIQKKPQLTKTDFPELPNSKAKVQPQAVPAGRMSFLDMLKKAKPEVALDDVVEKNVSQKGMVVLGRNKNGLKPTSSWGDEKEDINFSVPVQFNQEYYEEDEEEDYVDDVDYYTH
jgi:hypothetical protein